MAVDTTIAAERRAELWRGPLLIVAVAGAVAVLGGLLGLRDAQVARSFAVVFLSIVLEAFPFIVLASIVGAAVETWAPERVFKFIARLPAVLAVPVAGLLGSFLPICDCGSVPVARRLARRGLHPGAAVAFMLAAPVVNPIVVFGTIVAFRLRPQVVWGRMALAYIVALVVAWTLSPQARDMLTDRGGDHPHDHEHGSFFQTLANDTVFMGRYLVIGALGAATIQTFVPRSILSGLSSSVPLSIVGMMVLAMGLSICAQADAFVAASFTSFAPAAQLAFVTFGPMVDLKLLSVYSGAFGAQAARRLAIAVALPVLVGALWFHALTT